MDKQKLQDLRQILLREEILRKKFLYMKGKVTDFIEELNAHDEAWQIFWRENIGFEKPARFVHKGKHLLIQQPKNLYQKKLDVEGIFYKDEHTTIDFVEEEKPIELDTENEKG